MAQISLMRSLGICYPRTWAFSDVSSLHERRREIVFPALLKPNQGGSGARMARIESLDELTALLEDNPELWRPDNLLLLQELLAYDLSQGIVRMEYLDGELLYAIRVIAGDSFNLCPSEVCNPGHPGLAVSGAPVSEVEGPQFIPFPEVPQEAVETGRRLFQTAQLDVGAVEYLETEDGRLVFYDINANSNLRRSIGEELGFDPFERVADYLIRELRREFFRDPALKKGRVSVFQ